MRTDLVGLVLVLASVLPAVVRGQDTSLTMTLPPCIASCPNGIMADPYFGGSTRTFTCTFTDPLPARAELHSITINQDMGNGRTYTYLGTPSVSISVDGTSLGSKAITNLSHNCDSPATWSYASSYYPTGYPSYVYRGTNTFNETISGGTLYTAEPQIVLSFYIPVRVAASSGNNQTGAVGSPLEQKLVARLTGPSAYDVAGQTVTFSVASEPSRTTGTAVGADG